MDSKLSAFLIVTILGHAQAQGYYAIASPGSIRPNSKYSVHLSVSDVPQNTKIKLTLKGPEYINVKELEVPSNSERSVTFDLGAIREGDYALEAKGLSGFIFENATKLEFVKNPPRVFLQTDKPMYKHGQTIQFRAIFLDQYLLPAKVAGSNISVIIKDAGDNRIQRFTNIVLNTGVFKGKLILAEYVVSGMWTLEVFQGLEILANKSIEVKEYKLPMFEVVLEAPNHVSLKEKSFRIAARARYTFGKPVAGNCILEIIRKEQKPIRKEFIIKDGHGEMNVNLSEFNNAPQTIQINATIKDRATSIVNSTSKSIDIRANSYKFNTPDMNYDCDGPTDSFTYRAGITHLNETSIGVDEEVNLSIDRNDWGTEVDTFPDYDGNVDMEIMCENSTNINVTFKYDGISSMGKITLYRLQNIGRGGVYVKTQYPAVDSTMDIYLESPEIFSSFVCVIVGRGNIVYNTTIKIPNGGSSRKHTFSITPTYEMMPYAHIFVYFFKNGKIIYYETTFSVKKQFENSISIDTTKKPVEPGSLISITVNTEPNSYVGLLGIDKSVLLLGSGNDFDVETIFDKLGSVKTETPKLYLPSSGSYPGGNAGLVTMTNARYDELTSDEKTAPKTKPTQQPRRNFLETFAFIDFPSVDGEETVKELVPDTITSWVITGFSINPKTGFTLTTSPTVLTTFKGFFISVNLPYAVKVGENIPVPVVVFNYLGKSVRTSVTMEIDNEEYEFVSDINSKKFTKSTNVRKDKTKTVTFRIRPKVTGMITLRISAETSAASDAIVKKLKVDFTGITEFKNMDFYISEEENKTINLNIPPDSVKDSEYIEISVMNFIMGSMLNLINNGENFDQLISSPTGCGEQNMIRTVPSLLVMKYLQSTNTSNKIIFERAKSYLRTGYQRELTYKISDGSFSTWSHTQGITWLTAYVMRIFHEAKSYIFVDDAVLKRGLDFLVAKQEADGSFKEDGSLVDFATLNKLSLTASVVHALLENTQYSDQHKAIVNKGLQYIKNNVKQNKDIRAVALCLYVLQLRKDPMVTELLTALDAKALTNGDQKWWQYADTPQNIDVYVTGYILLTMIELNKPVTPIVKWLVSKRNSNGGFASTLETEAGLRALATYASKYKEQPKNLRIKVSSEGKLLQEFNVAENSTDINKKIKLPKHIRELHVSAIGNGKATFQISYHYNSLTSSNLTFNLNSTYTSRPPLTNNTLEICAHLRPGEFNQTGMAVMEVTLPSSEKIAPDCCDLTHSKKARVQSVERSNSDQKLNIYFDGFSKDRSDCVNISTVTAYDVTNQEPGSVVIYDYYQKQSKDVYFYDVLT